MERPPPPSAYVPLARRFTNERARELRETRQLYERVAVLQAAFNEDVTTIGRRVAPVFSHLSQNLFVALAWVMHELIEQEVFASPVPPPALDRMDLKEFVEYRNLLYAKEYFFTNQDRLLPLFEEALERLLGGIADQLPVMEEPSPFTIPLINALPEPALQVEKIYGTVVDARYTDRGLFKQVSDVLYRNLCKVSGRKPYEESNKPWRNAVDSSLPLEELVSTYLAGSPFEELLNLPVALKLTHEDRFNHMHIVGGTGAGKTSLIENLLLYDLRSDDPPSIVIVDPHGDLIRGLTHADLGIEDRLVIIDPRDIRNPPALNVFALNRERLASYDEVTREQVTAGVIQTFDYLFSGLVGADLTAKQGVFFRYVARLMLSLPDTLGRNATIIDMLKLMSDPAPYAEAIEALPDIPREFFLRDFASPTFRDTKGQIRYRLQAIIENPTLARLFTTEETKVDLFGELNRGSIILVDTAKDFLKSGSSNFGRLFISLVLQAVLERAALSEWERKDTFLYVDEAASYFDSNVDDLLTDARKYRCGLVLAHQYLDQASGQLRSSLAANTGIKFASGLSAGDARSLASEMRTTPDFILSQPRLRFAAHIRNVTPQAVSIPIQPGALKAEPRLSEEAFADLVRRNRERVSWPSEVRATRAANDEPEADVAPSVPASDEDISKEW